MAHMTADPTDYTIWTLDELEEMPTLSEGQADDLKIDEGDVRIWLSRCSVGDGEPFNNKVTLEQLVDGRWVETHIWPAPSYEGQSIEVFEV